MNSTALQSLADKIGASAAYLSESEQAQYRLMLGLAAGGLAPRGEISLEVFKQQAFATVLQCLAKLEEHGLSWRGRPDFMTNELLKTVRDEAAHLRSRAEPSDRYFLSAVGPQAQALTQSASLQSFVSKNDLAITPSGNASYIYYEGEGSGLDPHVDSDSYSVNMIFVLRHDYEEKPSKLILFRPDGEADRVLLQPGECAILRGSGTVHAREDLKRNECVTLLTIGFKGLRASSSFGEDKCPSGV